jgi:tetratricopeptide (TPR) repeat protein
MFAPGLGISIILFILLGLLVALDTPERSELDLSMRPIGGRALSGVLILVVVCAGVLLAAGATTRTTLAELFVAKAAADYNTGSGLPHALTLVQDALILDPDSALAHRAAVELGILQLRELASKGATANTAALQTMLKHTIAEGLAAVSADSSDYQNWLELAGLYKGLGDSGIAGAYDNAQAAYKKAAAANPTNPIPLVNAGQIALATGDATSSISYLDAALVLKPDLPAAYYLRSQAKAIVGDLAGATLDAERAVSLAQQDPIAWYNLGAVFYVSGDYTDAVSALSQAASLNTNYANAYFVLSLAYQKTGDRPLALAAMQKVNALSPGNATVEQALAYLESASSTPVALPTKPK